MKKTIGQIATELKQSDNYSVNPQEIQRATEKEYLDNLIWCVKHALKQIDCSSIDGHEECVKREAFSSDFYVSALLKKEKLLDNVLRNYFVASKTCPTPTYDQTIYKYDYQKQSLEFLWVVPDRETCLTLRENRDIVVPAERGLLQFVLDFYSNKLLEKCKILNGELLQPGNILDPNKL